MALFKKKIVSEPVIEKTEEAPKEDRKVVFIERNGGQIAVFEDEL